MARSGESPVAARIAGTLLRNLAFGARDAFLYPIERALAREWLAVSLTRGVSEASPAPGWLAGLRPAPPTLMQVLQALRRAARDSSLRGILIRLGRAPLGWGQVSSLARAVSELRSAGKPVVVYANATGNAGAWLGARADHFWLAPQGRLDLLGVRASAPFVRGTLDKLDIRAELVNAGRYKSFGEQLVREGHSEASREMLDSVVESLYGSLVDGLRAGNTRDAETARRWIDEGPYRAEQARDLGLVDDLVYPDDLPRRLAGLVGTPDPEAEARPVSLPAYLRVRRRRFRWTPLSTGPRRVAVVSLVGAIRAGSATRRGVSGLLHRIEKDRSVRAVVLRVSCPGGDALASDLIWHAARRLARSKPLVASLGDVAASGGYYVAMAAHEIVAEPTTLTGSIGVAMPWIEVDAFLERFGVSFDAVERGRHAGIYDATRPRTPEERQLLRRQVEQLYKDFVAKAADARGMEPEALDRVAQGRVWTGEQALERGLVDRIGDLDLALVRAHALAGLDAADSEVVTPGLPRTLLPFATGGDSGDWLNERLLWCPVQVPLR